MNQWHGHIVNDIDSPEHRGPTKCVSQTLRLNSLGVQDQAYRIITHYEVVPYRASTRGRTRYNVVR